MGKQRFADGQIVRNLLNSSLLQIVHFEPYNNTYCVKQVTQLYAWSHKWINGDYLTPLF